MTKNVEHNTWLEANHDYLVASLSVLRCGLEQYLADENGKSEKKAEYESAKQSLDEAGRALPSPSALESLCSIFGLTPFERDVVLLCAGVELDSRFASLCAAFHGGSPKSPTFSLALATLSDPHWSALTPAAPLRYWRLVEFGAGHTLTQIPLRIDERILHYLNGVHHTDERLAGVIDPLHVNGDLVPSHRKLVERIVSIWSQNPNGHDLPVVQLCGNEVQGKREIAAAVCSELKMTPALLTAQAIPGNPAETESLIRLWEREAVLSGRALLIDCQNLETGELDRNTALKRFLERTRGAIVLLTRDRVTSLQRPVITFEVHTPGTAEQRAVWETTLRNASVYPDGNLEIIISQFSLSPTAIQTVCTEAVGRVNTIDSRVKMGSSRTGTGPATEIWDILWDSCRLQTRPQLDNLAQRIEPAATWQDLVLPRLQMTILREIAVHVRQRLKVYETWGFADKNTRGLGISALFTGSSGTGKTMAAEVLANELRFDLYRIDLSQVVSKYIGETEKNLRRVFDAAEEGGAILLFDEADALFGKRSEVKDSHDRYANIEISYLLQRMESYRGLAILTTNMKEALDQAFLRRIRFVIQFPFPDAGQRLDIWRRIFPARTPTEFLDLDKLARLNVAGGTIRNIALNAAFLAADAGEAVRMNHLLHAARSEYVKLERPLMETEIGGWL
jgi:hypothetical protein